MADIRRTALRRRLAELRRQLRRGVDGVTLGRAAGLGRAEPSRAYRACGDRLPATRGAAAETATRSQAIPSSAASLDAGGPRNPRYGAASVRRLSRGIGSI